MTGNQVRQKGRASFKEGIGTVLKSINTNGAYNYFLFLIVILCKALYKSICSFDKSPYFDNLDILHFNY